VRDIIVSRIRERGPITVAEFMELALYHSGRGYYASAARRSGRGGDFFTSVDVGPLFGEMVAVQLDEMWHVLATHGAAHLHLVEVAAGDGRLTRDVLDAAASEPFEFLHHTRVTLIDRSAAALAAHTATFPPPDADAAHSLATTIPIESRVDLPSHITGVILANELLDAMPVHVIEVTEAGLVEIYVGLQDGRLAECPGPLSDPAIRDYIDRMNVRLEAGTRIEAGLRAAQWMRDAADALERGFLLLLDYGHEARELYSAVHAGGTLTTYRRHAAGMQHWLDEPGEADLTSHVNLTAIRLAAESAGLHTLGITDQTYFLTALGLLQRLSSASDQAAVSRRLAAKTLLMPGGLGSTMKVIVFAKNVGHPRLRGLSWGRVT
jgi:SAM-dependent MidA family methyltransferase